MIKPIDFIRLLRESFAGSEYVYTHGSCYQLYRILASLYPTAAAYYKRGHIVTLIDGLFYDITGLVDGTGYAPHKEADGCHDFRFSLFNNGWECPACDGITAYSDLCT